MKRGNYEIFTSCMARNIAGTDGASVNLTGSCQQQQQPQDVHPSLPHQPLGCDVHDVNER